MYKAKSHHLHNPKRFNLLALYIVRFFDKMQHYFYLRKHPYTSLTKELFSGRAFYKLHYMVYRVEMQLASLLSVYFVVWFCVALNSLQKRMSNIPNQLFGKRRCIGF